MNVHLLIDAITRQTAVLVAQLATAAGIRAPLAHLSNQVFLDLVEALEGQGLGRKVVADMFGLALRSYQMKVQRLTESATERNRTLWEAVLTYLREAGPARRRAVMERFRRDDEGLVGGILHDLVESGLVYRAGRGDATTYRAAGDEELGAGAVDDEGVAAFVQVLVYRLGPVTRDRLAAETRMNAAQLDAGLARLVADGRVACASSDAGPVYRCDDCFLPMESPVGWEASLFDHYQAMVAAMCNKLRRGRSTSRPADLDGGSTYSFDLWEGHAYEERVTTLLRRMRREVSALMAEVTAYNHAATPNGGRSRVVFYVGQTVVVEDEAATGGEK